MKHRSLFIAVLTYVIWGLLPIYWQLLSHVPSILTLCCRIIFSLVFTMAIVTLGSRTEEFKALIKNRRTLLTVGAASLFITVNWGLYIYAVSSGHTLDASLGYYMNPLLVFALGALVFKEKMGRLQIVAILIAAAGVIVTLLMFGSVPIISLALAASFAIYSTLKKIVHVDPILSIALETLIISPIALIVSFTFFSGAISALSFGDVLLLVLAGPATAIPMILYSSSINDLDFKTLGFIQYISPTLTMIVGLVGGEALTLEKIIPFTAVIIALAVYSTGLLRKKPVKAE